jgi:hypothetical protein
MSAIETFWLVDRSPESASLSSFMKALKCGSFFRMSQKSKNVIDIFMAVDVICDWTFNSKSVGDVLE